MPATITLDTSVFDLNVSRSDQGEMAERAR
jgi:hypothetical protein